MKRCLHLIQYIAFYIELLNGAKICPAGKVYDIDLGTVENDMQLCLDTILVLTSKIFKGAGLFKVVNCH